MIALKGMYRTIILPHFKRQLKELAKKYRHLDQAVIDCLESFRPDQHTAVGNSVYKIRLRSKDVARGKSKSFRMMALVIEADRYCIPIALYFKGDQQDMTKKELNDHLEIILFELRYAHTKSIL